jgi:hypothetical protein
MFLTLYFVVLFCAFSLFSTARFWDPKGSEHQKTKKVKKLSFTDIHRILNAIVPKINILLQIGIFNNFKLFI